MCAIADRLLAVNNGKFKFVLDRECLHVCRGRRLGLALQTGEMVHVFLQRVPIGCVAIN